MGAFNRSPVAVYGAVTDGSATRASTSPFSNQADKVQNYNFSVRAIKRIQYEISIREPMDYVYISQELRNMLSSELLERNGMGHPRSFAFVWYKKTDHKASAVCLVVDDSTESTGGVMRSMDLFWVLQGYLERLTAAVDARIKLDAFVFLNNGTLKARYHVGTRELRELRQDLDESGIERQNTEIIPRVEISRHTGQVELYDDQPSAFDRALLSRGTFTMIPIRDLEPVFAELGIAP